MFSIFSALAYRTFWNHCLPKTLSVAILLKLSPVCMEVIHLHVFEEVGAALHGGVINLNDLVSVGLITSSNSKALSNKWNENGCDVNL